jgi:hypothetical protein
MGIHAQHMITPQPLPPVVRQPYPARGPVEPWERTLRVMMVAWGALALAAFATPTKTNPLFFHWDLIANAEGTARVLVLILPAVGLLSVILGLIPMPALPRGLLAAIIGLAAVYTPLVMLLVDGASFEWKTFVAQLGALMLVPALLARHEYTDSFLTRVLVTIGVLALLLRFLVPDGTEIPIVNIFKGLINLEGSEKVRPAVELGLIVLVVLSLLAWLPAPSTGAAVAFAWLLILYPLIQHVAYLLAAGNIVEAVKASPYRALTEWVQFVVYAVLIGYGVATVIGKKLE